MTSSFYETNPDDPEAPVVLSEYRGLVPGMPVRYTATPPLSGPLVIAELVRFPGAMTCPSFVQAVLNGGEYEVNADNLASNVDEDTGEEFKVGDCEECGNHSELLANRPISREDSLDLCPECRDPDSPPRWLREERNEELARERSKTRRTRETTREFMQRTDPVAYQQCRDAGRF